MKEMEEILIALAQFIIEALLPLLAELFFDVIIDILPSSVRLDRYFALILVGIVTGSLTGLFIPSPFANHIGIQAITAVFGPILAALIIPQIFAGNRFKDEFLELLQDGWKIYWFCFPFLIGRSMALHHQLFQWW